MDKIKNIIHPGKREEDEVLYGSGQSSDPVHSGVAGHTTGHGSHPGSSSETGQHYGTDGPIGSPASGASTAGHSTGNASYTSRSLMPGESPDDNASIASIKSGVHGSNPGSKLTDSSAIGSDTGVDVNKPLPHTPASGSALTGGNLPDRSVGGPGHHTTGSENPSAGRSFPLSGQAENIHNPGETSSGGTATQSPNTSGYGLGTGPTSSSTHQGHLGRDAALGTGVAGAGLAEHERHGHGIASSTSGPHSSNLANRADPRVDSDLDGSRTTGSTGYGSSTSGLGSASGTTGTTTTVHSHEHLGHGHVYEGDPCPPGEHHNVLTSGPHGTDAANFLDPHVPRDSLRSIGIEHAGTGLTSGTSGIGIGSGATGYGSTSTTAGPHSSNLANKADPRVDSNLDGFRTAGTPAMGGATAGTSSTGPTGASSDYRNPYSSSGIDPRVDSTPRSTEPGTSGGHHLGRDAGVVGGIGALGAGAYEAQRHHGSHQPTSTSATGTTDYGSSSTTVPSSGTTGMVPSSATQGYNHQPRDRHLGRDAGIVGGAGVLGAGAYEAEKHHHGSHQPTSTSASGTGTSGYPSSTSGLDDRSRAGDHHLGRDAGIVGGAGALGAGAYEAERHHGSHQPTSTTTAGTSSYPSNTSGLDDHSRSAGDHHGREVAAAGTVGAIGGGAAAGEFSKVEAEKREKELAKERAQHEKQLHKAEKQHEKDVAKHEKAHEKAHEKELAKHDKHHEREIAKHDKKHDKELAELEKHERAKEHDKEHTHGEKKHGGLFGFLHRDKTDPELKEEEAARQERLHHGAGAAAGTTAAAYGQDHEGRNRLHKDPPADHVPMNEGGAIRGSPSTSYGEAPKSGYASQVTGGTGTTAAATGNTGITGTAPLDNTGRTSSTAYEEAPKGGYASRVTGGTGTSALSTGTAPRASTGGTGNDSSVVIEPHTGLPMDLSKGDGRGGTDSNPIPGYHDHHSGAQR
ncbi:MAG: hypothetical protein M1836_001875 [Candelina mexicana]|nr:MAG: hypothetical protein M1836_001875 [Candelina mexicana]